MNVENIKISVKTIFKAVKIAIYSVLLLFALLSVCVSLIDYAMGAVVALLFGALLVICGLEVVFFFIESSILVSLDGLNNIGNFYKRFRQIRTPPGSFILKLAKLLVKEYRSRLEQEVCDMRIEYYEAYAEGDFFRAKCVIGNYYLGIIWSSLIWIATRIKEVIKISN